jgi:hypothetical protein
MKILNRRNSRMEIGIKKGINVFGVKEIAKIKPKIKIFFDIRTNYLNLQINLPNDY